MSPHRHDRNPQPPQTVRIWARNEDVAELMVSEGSDTYPVELDGDTYADIGGRRVLPFITAARVVRCCNCQRLMYAADYIGADHACIPAGQFDGVDLDVQAAA
jgi:transposase